MKTQIRKRSGKRDAVLGIIRSTKTHPPAGWVYERLKPDFPGLSLGTVYRNIRVLLEDGGLVSVGVVNGEERFDGMVEPHPHFICEKCGTVIDIDARAVTGRKKLVEISGCAIDKRKTVFYGVCKACNVGNAAVGR